MENQTNFESLDDLILLKIFSFIQIKSLLNLKSTCKKWNVLIGEAINNRKKIIETFLFNKKIISKKLQCIYENDFNNEIDTELFSLSNVPDLYICFLTNSFKRNCILSEGEKNCLEEQTKPDDFKDQYATEENFHSFPKRQKISNDEESKLNSKTSVFLRKRFNKVSSALFVYAPGIIGTNNLNTKTFEIEDKFGIGGLILPKRSKNFRFNLINRIESSKKEIDFGKKSNERIKFVILLANLSFNLKNIQKLFGNNQNFAISGGYVNSADYNNERKISNLVLLALISDDNEAEDKVRVAQIVIPDLGKEEVEAKMNEKLKILQKTGILENSNARTVFGFQVSCCAKGKNFFNEENFESNLFRKIFPNVPLVGFFAHGELTNNDFLPDFKQKNFNYVNQPIMLLNYTSVFTIVSIET